MSVKLFCGFDFSGITSGGGFASGGSNDLGDSGSTAAQGWARFIKPRYLFHNKGIPTLSNTFAPPSSATSSGVGSCFGTNPSGGLAYGHGLSFSSAGAYNVATSVTRATYASTQGFQLGIVRNMVLPALSNNEYWFYFVVVQNALQVGLASSYEPSASWGAVFKWGDVEIKAKEFIIDPSTSGVGTRGQFVFAVKNNGTQIATVAVPAVATGNSAFFTNTQMHCFLRVKLHSTTGLIDFRVNGIPQSASYVDQNTVSATAEAAADVIFIGPPSFDNGTIAYAGGIDNILIDDAAWPTGIPTVFTFIPSSDDTLTNALAAGTSPTTVANALIWRGDAKALRFNANTGKALLNNPSPSTIGYDVNVLAFYGLCSRLSNRNMFGTNRLEVAMSLSAVESASDYVKNESPPFSATITPPETDNMTSSCFEIFEKPGGAGKYQTSELSSIKTALNTFTA